MSFTPQSADKKLQALAAKVIARSDLNDLSEGGAVATILAALADELALGEIYIERIRDAFHFKGAKGALLDERVAELPPSGMSRLGAGAASGTIMRVERLEDPGGGYPVAFTMAAGATFRREDDPSQAYRTISPYTFGIGIGYLIDIWVVAVTPGSQGNCAIGTINVVDSAEDDVISCNNYAPLTNGTNTETDQQLIVRVIKYLSSLAKCQPIALEYTALGYQTPDGNRVRFAHLREDPVIPGYSELVIDDGSGLAGTDRPGATATGTVPVSGSFLLWHESPATQAIQRIVVTDTFGGVSIYGPTDFTSIPERGLVYFPSGILQAGDVWEIGDQTGAGDQYKVFTGIIAGIQSAIEGSTSNPTARPGWRAAGVRVRVRPPTLQSLAMSVHLTPVSGVALSNISSFVLSDIVAFSQALAPGSTLYVSQLIDYVMNNKLLMNVKFFRHLTTDPLEDTEALSFYHAIRVSGADIEIISAPEE